MTLSNARRIVGIIGLLWGLSLIIVDSLMWQSWIKNGPTQQDESQGIVYEYNDHGRIVYLDSTHMILYRGTPIAGFGLAAILWFAVGRRYLLKKK
jgi:hypothetical protein